VLTISSQHVAVLGAVIYFSLRAFAGSAATRTHTTMALFWLYVLIAGASLSAIRAVVVATLVLATGLLGRRVATA
jgi:predicted membrane metal-binding protein